jgi:hypothetical protein
VAPKPQKRRLNDQKKGIRYRGGFLFIWIESS